MRTADRSTPEGNADVAAQSPLCPLLAPCGYRLCNPARTALME